MLINWWNGQGNFGSIDDDSAAAMRYTEARPHRIAEQCCWILTKTPSIFSRTSMTALKNERFATRLPQLLVNGSSGIAVGMATKYSAA